jgi:predicted TIM-barrel fold metal-dependent hydrolase
MWKHVRRLAAWGAACLLALACIGFRAALAAEATAPAKTSGDKPVAARSLWVDAHTHLEKATAAQSIAAALAARATENIARYLFLPSPFAAANERAFDIEFIRSVAGAHADSISIIGGGGTLNPMIQEAAREGGSDPGLEERFRQRAEEIARLGAAGFGELTASHRPSASTPSFQLVAPDHRFFLLLADIAAAHGMPITLHMEAVPETMALPASWKIRGLDAPAELPANIAAFERLLEHNRGARIVWAHGGWDNTGFRTPELCRRLLAANPNLYMELKIDPRNPGLNSPLSGGSSGTLKPEWLRLFRDFPDRFVLGSDQHYPMPAGETQRWEGVVALFNELPEELQRKFGVENAERIYRLSAR